MSCESTGILGCRASPSTDLLSASFVVRFYVLTYLLVAMLTVYLSAICDIIMDCRRLSSALLCVSSGVRCGRKPRQL